MDPLYEVLVPHLGSDLSSHEGSSLPPVGNTHTANYLTRLSTLSLADLTSTEPSSLLQSAQSHIRNLQALSKRSHKAVISSSTHLEQLRNILPGFGEKARELKDELPGLENAASEFAKKYDRSNDNEVLDRRKKAMLLSRNVDRVSDVLELPTLLSSTVSAAQTASTTSSSSTATSYASALDLHAHIKRLNALYPRSQIVSDVSRQAEAEIQNLTTILITALQSQNLKLAAAMRTVGWLRRVAPEMTESEGGAAKPAALSTRSFDISATQKTDDGALGTMLLVCRLQALYSTLEALEPLRDLADQETTWRMKPAGTKAQQAQPSATGGQSERYLKRYIEIFREQSFNIVGMYKSVFPSGLPNVEVADSPNNEDALLPLPLPVASFTSHLADMLSRTLLQYMPNITDKSSRESLLTQVLYCAGSLARLGADFGMIIALIEDDLAADEEETVDAAGPEWAAVMKKHRVQAGRLEVLARGVGSATRKGSIEVHSPSVVASAG